MRPATADLDALYQFVTVTIGALDHVAAIEVTPILTVVKRTGQVRLGSL